MKVYILKCPYLRTGATCRGTFSKTTGRALPVIASHGNIHMDAASIRFGGTAVMAVSFIVLLAAENLRPLRRLRKPRWPRYAANAATTAMAMVVGSLVVRPVGLGLAAVSTEKSLGLLHALPLPGWAQFIGGFLLMDLTFYYWHRLNHIVPFLWRFHSVHHIDPDLDVTTSMRFHFGEVGLSAFFRAAQVTVVGIAPVTYMAYELLFTLATLFHHSNLQLPLGVEKKINLVLVTPRMHGIHHSVVRSELNSNYSVIFRWWDTLNRSLVLNVPQSAITIGVGRYQRPGDNGILRLTALPFGPFARERAARAPRFGADSLSVMAQ